MNPALLLTIGLAGAAGAIARFGVTIAASRWLGPTFPWGTLAVNLAGCFLLGMVAQVAMLRPGFSEETRLIVGTGFLGAFTTFSTFGVDTFRAIEAAEWATAAANVSANLVGGLILVWLGFIAARAL